MHVIDGKRYETTKRERTIKLYRIVTYIENLRERFVAEVVGVYCIGMLLETQRYTL